MAKFSHPYLDLSRMEMLRRVRLKPQGAAEGTFAGPHKSTHRGTAVEFADYRDYVEGDDIRLVDWKVFARTDKYYVRLFEAERNLLTYLVIDTSGSMEYTGAAVTTWSKLEHACRLAAALGYLVISEGDELGLSLVNDTVDEHVPPRGSWPHLATVVDKLGGATPAGRTDLGGCLEEVYRRVSRRGVLMVLSDFIEAGPDFWKSVDLFRKSQFDVMLFQVVHPEEIDLPRVPMARFRDTEGRDGWFNAEPDVVRDMYRRRFAAFVGGMESASRMRGCDWYLARTDGDPYLFLKNCFLARDGCR
jgi:uncharacterized protein (DUF58 family)